MSLVFQVIFQIEKICVIHGTFDQPDAARRARHLLGDLARAFGEFGGRKDPRDQPDALGLSGIQSITEQE